MTPARPTRPDASPRRRGRGRHRADRRSRLRAPTVLLALALVVSTGAFDYEVRRGDTLSKIAAAHGTTVRAIAEANGIRNPNRIYVGQRLVIPGMDDGVDAAPAAGSHIVRPGESLSGIAARYGVSVTALAAANGIVDPNTVYVGTRLRITGDAAAPFLPSGGGTTTYIVQAGDTLSRIAARHGTTAAELAERNGLANPDRIYVGQVLEITSGWRCPVPGGSFFNDWGFPRSGGRFHEGTDLYAPRGTPVVAPVSGFLHDIVGEIGGLQFRLEGDDGHTYIGSHMDSFGKTGRVEAGDVIGTVGDSGNARGSRPHLHFEIHPNGGGAVNPYPALAAACGG